jgi:hypothetical protein
MNGHLSAEELIDHHYGGEGVDADHLRSCGACRDLSDRVARERSALKEACLVREEPAGLARQFPAMRFGAAAVGFCAVLITILWTVREEPAAPGTALAPPDPLAVEPEQGEDVCLAGLRWLARHQDEAGSWSRRPESCRCPAEGAPPVRRRDPEVERQARALVPGLGHEDPAERDRAAEALKKLGEAAEPVLAKAAVSGDGEVRARAGDLLREIARGREKPDVEATGLAVLAFAGAGYSHLSKDVYDGLCFGDVVRSGLLWLLRNQDAEGAVGPRPAEGVSAGNALGALALAELYGSTGSNLFKDAAQKAVDFVAAGQRRSGAWGPGHDDPAVTFWAADVIRTAEASGLQVGREVVPRASGWLKARAGKGGDFDAAAYLYFARWTLRGAFEGATPAERRRKRDACFVDPEAGALLDRVCGLDPREAPPLLRHAASYAIFGLYGNREERWKAWNEKLKPVFLRSESRKGCGYGASLEPGEKARLTALQMLASQVYYRFGSSFWDDPK